MSSQLTSAVLPKRHRPVFLRQIRRLKAVFVLEPGHQLFAVADATPQYGDDERWGQQHQQRTKRHYRTWLGLRDVETLWNTRRRSKLHLENAANRRVITRWDRELWMLSSTRRTYCFLLFSRFRTSGFVRGV